MANTDIPPMATPSEQEIFQSWVLVSLQRIYDLLLFDIYQKYGDDAAAKILLQHKNHNYMFPQPGGTDEEEGTTVQSDKEGL